MIQWAESMIEVDLQEISEVTTGSIGFNEDNIIQSFILNKGKVC